MLLQGPAKNGGGGPEALEGHTHAGPGPRPEWGPGKRRVLTHLEGAWAERTGLGRIPGTWTHREHSVMGVNWNNGERGIGAGDDSDNRLNWTVIGQY